MGSTGLSTFVNRTSELAQLEEWYSRPGPGLGIVFGRRRVGKTWLLTKFAEDKRVVRHTVRGRPLADELRQLSLVAHDTLKLQRRSLLDRPFTSWDDVFEVLSTAADTVPLLFIVDEFPELLGVDPELEEELRAVWDRVGMQSTHLKFIVCGSAERVMESLQEHDHAIFGRADLRLRVQPFRPHEAALMLRDATPSERAAAWGVCGGIPRYLAIWDDRASFRQNIDRLICNEQGLLLSEGELVLADEDLVGHAGKRLPEQILRAIAAGDTSHSAIASAVNTLPTRALKEMIDGHLLDKIIPVTAKAESTKTTYYRIADNFLAFWLSCVEPHKSPIEQGLGSTVGTVIARSFDDYMGLRYESAFREYLRRLAGEGRLGDEVVTIGEWWRTQGRASDDSCQLDAVVLAGRKRVPVIIGEAKWAKSVNGSSELGAMKRKLIDSGLADPDKVGFYVCARDTVTRSAGVTVVTAADIFS
jgi:AAA+ ATPase superfamily predicted ATPase